MEPAIDCICHYLRTHRDGGKIEVVGSGSLLEKIHVKPRKVILQRTEVWVYCPKRSISILIKGYKVEFNWGKRRIINHYCEEQRTEMMSLPQVSKSLAVQWLELSHLKSQLFQLTLMETAGNFFFSRYWTSQPANGGKWWHQSYVDNFILWSFVWKEKMSLLCGCCEKTPPGLLCAFKFSPDYDSCHS